MSLDNILHRKPPTPWERFGESPRIFLADLAYKSRRLQQNSTSGPEPTVRIVCISDTHNLQDLQPPLPKGDILIHPGDLTQRGTPDEVNTALTWISKQSHPHKIFIAGNHDACLDSPVFRDSLKKRFPNLIYLQETSVSLKVNGRELTFYGSPYTPQQGPWSFQYPRIPPSSNPDERNIWSHMSDGVDVLITHGPPRYHLDFNTGCIGLLTALWRVRPKLHVFGHIHAARGTEVLSWTKDQKAYERILSGIGGWWDLPVVFFGWVFRIWKGGASATPHTLLLNAAALGGFRDEKNHGALAVDI